MEVINFDESILRNQSIKRNISQLYNYFYKEDKKNSFQAISIAEYYDANKEILSSYKTGSMRDRIELVPLVYKTCFMPSIEEYQIFRKDYFKNIIYSYLFSQNLPLTSYKIDKETKKIIKPSPNTNYDEMVSNKWNFNDETVLREETIKFLFQNYLKEIMDIVKDLSDNQPDYFKTIKDVTYNNIQPNNITAFMNIIISNYKRIIELYKVYGSDEIRRKNMIEELVEERTKILKSLENVDKKIDAASGTQGKKLTFSSGTQSSKLFMYDNEKGFIQNLFFIFLLGLTSGLSFFCISSLIKFILNRI